MNPSTNIAIRAARQAGSIIMRSFSRLDTLTVTEKDVNDYVSEVDRNAEQAIIETIRKAYPAHAILAEESGSHGKDEFQWIIDPLDGTTNYLHGFPQFAISIAMMHRGRLENGVIYDPVRDEIFVAVRGAGALLYDPTRNDLFFASRGRGAFLNDRRLRVTDQKTLKGALLGTGIPYRDQRYMDAYLGMLKTLTQETAGIRRPGSAALDFAYVAAGRLDGFWELGLSVWDFAAGALLVQEAGGVVSDIRGGSQPLDTGNVIVRNVRLHRDMVAAIRPHVPDELRA